MARVLVIDDNSAICELIADLGQRLGHDVSYALSLEDGVQEATSKAFDLVFLDVRLPDGNGLDALPQIRETPSRPEVIIITGAGDPDGAELAIRNGAWDYIEKPFSNGALHLPFVRAIQFHQQKAALGLNDKSPQSGMSVKWGIIGDSPKMRVCLDLLAQAANSSASVLITGETGTGKELFARAIHQNSDRAERAFVVVDCAALTETLVESVLFGHEKGAFTGAHKTQDGMIRQADKGTLFLDEVGELPLSVQKAFLRVLQEHRFRPVGGEKEVQSSFRLIAATNRNLEQMVQEDQFRKDLFFRIRSLTIELPPLRERTEDIRELTIRFIARQCERQGRAPKEFSPEFLESLTRYDWPGNVRELVHAVESSLIASSSEPVLFPDHLPIHIRIQVARASVSKSAPTKDVSPAALESSTKLPSLAEVRDSAFMEIEKDYLRRLMALTGMDIKEACRISGLSRSRLYALLKRHEIVRNLP